MFNLFKKQKKDLVQIESDYREISNRTSWHLPPNLGWLECKLSYEEISQALEISSDNARKINSRLRKKLFNWRNT